jgi:hypothetical protein
MFVQGWRGAINVRLDVGKLCSCRGFVVIYNELARDFN